MMTNLDGVRVGDYFMVKGERWTATEVKRDSTEALVIKCSRPDGRYGELVITAWTP